MAGEGTVDLGIPGLVNARPIGTGGFAVVYRADQPTFQRAVAVKLLITGRLDEATSHRFQRECRLMGALSEHPSIVTVLDAGFTAAGQPYLLMAYMPGGSLEDRIAADGPLSWRQAVPICVRMAGALEVAHRADVVHRDVKPANILLGSYGEPQLTDFGIARVTGGPETRSGLITASMAHAAPEVVEGQRPTVLSDVYSLGSTMYALLAGEPAFTEATDESVFPLLLRIRSDPVPDLRARGVPDAVCAAVEAAMAKDPSARPPSAAAFGELLRNVEIAAGLAPTSMLLAFAEDDPVPDTVTLTPGPPPPEPAPQPAEPAPPPAAGAVTAQVAAGAGSGPPQPGGPPGGGTAPAPNGPSPLRRTLLAGLALVLAVIAGVAVAVAFLDGDEPGTAATTVPPATAPPPLAPPPTTAAPPTTPPPATTAAPGTTAAPATTQPPPSPLAGTKIAFHSERDGNFDVYVMDADGSNQTRLTDSPADDYSPEWSPDGTKIAFHSNRDGDEAVFAVYVMDADGSNVIRIAGGVGAAWSPDGTRIVCLCNGEITAFDPDGSNETRLTTSPGSDANPAWSPDGTRIAFHSDREDDWEVYVMDADGSNQTRLTANPGFDTTPAWSPDGTRIAFHSERDGNRDVYVMNADGSNQTRLTDNPAIDGNPTWSPDGTTIGFNSDRDGNDDIYVMDADGANQTRLTDNPAPDASPSWSPVPAGGGG